MQLVKIPISDIRFIEEDRQRKGLGTIDGKPDPNQKSKTVEEEFDGLMNSIQTNGLLQPIGISKDNELLYGRRRLAACIRLGWKEIDAIVDPQKDLSDLDKQLIELDENIRRLDLSWPERQAAIAKINRIRQLQDPSWNQKRTANELKISQAEVSRAVTMDQVMNIFPELAKAKTLNAAMSQAKSKAKTMIRKHEVASNPAKYEEVSKKVAHGLAEKLILTLPDGFTKHIVTDGPFGIDYDKRPSAEGAHEAYVDTPESYRERTAAMAPHMYRILADDGFLIWFLAHDHFEWTKQLFRSVGFDVDPVPLMWNRSDGRCYTTRPDKYFGKGYDIALHCIKGDPQMINRSRNRGKNGSGNVFTYKGIEPKDKEHIVERPPELYADIIQCISLEGEKIVDFFAGSGNCIAAAAALKRDYWCCEMNVNHIPLIIQNVYANTPQLNGA